MASEPTRAPLPPGGRGLLRTALQHRPSELVGATLLLLAGAASEGIGLLLLIPLLGAVGLDVGQGGIAGLDAADAAGIGSLADWIRARFAAVGVPLTLSSALLAYVAAVSLQALLMRAGSVAAERWLLGFGAGLRSRLFARILGSRWTALRRRDESELHFLLVGESERVESAVAGGWQLGALLVQATVAAALALIVSPLLSLAALAGGALLALLQRRWSRRAERIGERVSEAGDRVHGAAAEALAGFEVVKSLGAEARLGERFTSLAAELAARDLDAHRNRANGGLAFQVGAVLLLALLVLLGVRLLALPLSALVLLLYVASRLFPQIGGVIGAWQALRGDLPAWARLARLDGELADAADGLPAEPGVAAPRLDRELRFEGVQVKLPGSRTPILDGIELILPAGRVTALTGPSGAGKSTLARLAAGLLDPSAGRIAVDDVPLEPARWRAAVGYVPQDAFVFPGSVRDNLLLARPGASEAELWNALERASLRAVIDALPEQLDTRLGDRGSRLSGGERQRLAIARALLRAPRLLVLDEATSALDAASEQEVQRAIDALLRSEAGLTVLLVAHRPSALRGAERIVRLEGGRIASISAPRDGALPPRGGSAGSRGGGES